MRSTKPQSSDDSVNPVMPEGQVAYPAPNSSHLEISSDNRIQSRKKKKSNQPDRGAVELRGSVIGWYVGEGTQDAPAKRDPLHGVPFVFGGHEWPKRAIYGDVLGMLEALLHPPPP